MADVKIELGPIPFDPKYWKHLSWFIVIVAGSRFSFCIKMQSLFFFVSLHNVNFF